MSTLQRYPLVIFAGLFVWWVGFALFNALGQLDVLSAALTGMAAGSASFWANAVLRAMIVGRRP